MANERAFLPGAQDRGSAAVDGIQGARDVPRPRRSQEGDDFGDLVRVHVEVGGGPEPGRPGVVDQDVDICDLVHEAVDFNGGGQVGGDEPRAAAPLLDRRDDLRPTGGVTAVHHDGEAFGP